MVFYFTHRRFNNPAVVLDLDRADTFAAGGFLCPDPLPAENVRQTS